jgi:hypothetical protein
MHHSVVCPEPMRLIIVERPVTCMHSTADIIGEYRTAKGRASIPSSGRKKNTGMALRPMPPALSPLIAHVGYVDLRESTTITARSFQLLGFICAINCSTTCALVCETRGGSDETHSARSSTTCKIVGISVRSRDT